ncbi:MAG: hypothetical protein OXH86_00495, partial [Acidimicrobiaceae bacterium]|nr:hypothetical protein [Acidimicrobiaceae bacterium]
MALGFAQQRWGRLRMRLRAAVNWVAQGQFCGKSHADDPLPANIFTVLRRLNVLVFVVGVVGAVG